jgi:hypothetical protein
VDTKRVTLFVTACIPLALWKFLSEAKSVIEHLPVAVQQLLGVLDYHGTIGWSVSDRAIVENNAVARGRCDSSTFSSDAFNAVDHAP